MMKKKKILVIISVFSIILCLAACSSKRSSSMSNSASSPSQNQTMDKAVKSKPESSFGSSDSPANATTSGVEAPKIADASKIVRTYSIQLQTLKFDDAITAISNKCTEVGGYVESSNISGTDINVDNTLINRNANLKLRIPKEQYLNFKAFFKGLGSIINQQETGENITQQYYDTDAHLTSLKVQEERLLELLKKSGDLKSILDIEKELQTVRYSIETLTTSLKKMDNLVDYTTFSISVNEVQKIKDPTVNPVSLTDKISKGFQTSVNLLITIFKNLLILIAYLIPFAAIILIVYLIFRYAYKIIKRKQNKIIASLIQDEKQKK